MSHADEKEFASPAEPVLDFFGDVSTSEAERAAREQDEAREKEIREELERIAKRDAAEKAAREQAELEEAKRGLVKRTGWRILFSGKAIATIVLMLVASAIVTGLVLNPEMTLFDVLAMYQAKFEYLLGLTKQAG